MRHNEALEKQKRLDRKQNFTRKYGYPQGADGGVGIFSPESIRTRTPEQAEKLVQELIDDGVEPETAYDIVNIEAGDDEMLLSDPRREQKRITNARNKQLENDFIEKNYTHQL